MKAPKAAIPAAVPVTYPTPSYPTAGGRYIGNDETGEFIKVEPEVVPADEADGATASKEQN